MYISSGPLQFAPYALLDVLCRYNRTTVQHYPEGVMAWSWHSLPKLNLHNHLLPEPTGDDMFRVIGEPNPQLHDKP